MTSRPTAASTERRGNAAAWCFIAGTAVVAFTFWRARANACDGLLCGIDEFMAELSVAAVLIGASAVLAVMARLRRKRRQQ